MDFKDFLESYKIKNFAVNQRKAAELIGVSQSTLSNWERDGIGIEFILNGKRKLYPVIKIWEFLNTHTIKMA